MCILLNAVFAAADLPGAERLGAGGDEHTRTFARSAAAGAVYMLR